MRYQLRSTDPVAARELGRALALSPVIAQLLLQRGYGELGSAREVLSPQLSGLTRPEAMVDRDLAADRLARAIRAGEQIAIFGDYDVDGTTSAAILADILEALGGTIAVQIGQRFSGGYGLSDEALTRLLESRPS